MKKWYVITGILTLLLIISISVCSINAAELNRIKVELSGAEEELARLDRVKEELDQLRSVKEFEYGNGLRVSEIEKISYGVGGKVQNISNELMGKVCVVTAVYEEDGSLKGVGVDWVYDLYPQETGSWTSAGRHGASYSVYAFGNRSE